MGDSPNIDRTRTIAWQAGTSSAHLAECQKMALQQQHDLLQDAQQHMAAWARRRQVALETGIDALTRMSACKTPVEMTTICGEWMSGSINRILADMEDAQAHTARMAQYFQKASSAYFASPQATPAEIHQPVATGEPQAQPQLREAAD
ncbi:MAG: hypothetical protein HYZ40_14000 [Rhodospirillales bacterium]|nr:hypothetical protein [Rhodospirillales bacterium]